MADTEAKPSLKVRFTKSKETPGTWQYAEPDEGQPEGHPGYPVSGSIYLKKAAVVALGSPATITVTVEAG